MFEFPCASKFNFVNAYYAETYYYQTVFTLNHDNLHTSQQQCGSHLAQLFLHQDNIYRKMPGKQISFGKIDLIIS